MKYFIDTEFLEGKQKESFPISLFRKETPNTIDLISIGIVAEDGREYYAISKDFNLKEAWNRYDLVQESGDMRNMFPNGRKLYWLRENVLKPIYYQFIDKDIDFHDYDRFFTYDTLKNLIDKKGKTNKEIAKEIKLFCLQESIFVEKHICAPLFKTTYETGTPEFYAYYADYDWVVFCWLFGKMIDLPKGFPMYCKDLKQMMDQYAFDSKLIFNIDEIQNFKSNLEWIKNHPNYPEQKNQHSAIDDARWNKQLFEFLNQL